MRRCASRAAPAAAPARAAAARATLPSGRIAEARIIRIAAHRHELEVGDAARAPSVHGASTSGLRATGQVGAEVDLQRARPTRRRRAAPRRPRSGSAASARAAQEAHELRDRCPRAAAPSPLARAARRRPRVARCGSRCSPAPRASSSSRERLATGPASRCPPASRRSARGPPRSRGSPRRGRRAPARAACSQLELGARARRRAPGRCCWPQRARQRPGHEGAAAFRTSSTQEQPAAAARARRARVTVVASDSRPIAARCTEMSTPSVAAFAPAVAGRRPRTRRGPPAPSSASASSLLRPTALSDSSVPDAASGRLDRDQPHARRAAPARARRRAPSRRRRAGPRALHGRPLARARRLDAASSRRLADSARRRAASASSDCTSARASRARPGSSPQATTRWRSGREREHERAEARAAASAAARCGTARRARLSGAFTPPSAARRPPRRPAPAPPRRPRRRRAPPTDRTSRGTTPVARCDHLARLCRVERRRRAASRASKPRPPSCSRWKRSVCADMPRDRLLAVLARQRAAIRIGRVAAPHLERHVAVVPVHEQAARRSPGRRRERRQRQAGGLDEPRLQAERRRAPSSYGRDHLVAARPPPAARPARTARHASRAVAHVEVGGKRLAQPEAHGLLDLGAAAAQRLRRRQQASGAPRGRAARARRGPPESAPARSSAAAQRRPGARRGRRTLGWVSDGSSAPAELHARPRPPGRARAPSRARRTTPTARGRTSTATSGSGGSRSVRESQARGAPQRRRGEPRTALTRPPRR